MIINCLAKPTRDFRVSIGSLGKFSDKRVRIGETWSCRIKADWEDPVNSSFFWTRLDDGSEIYATKQQVIEAQRPKNHIFVNESVVTIDYPTDVDGVQYKPLVNVEVLATDSFISGMKATVTGGDFGGAYNSVGVVYRDSNGEWSVGGSLNAFRIDTGENKYIVFDESLSSWVLIETLTDHNHIGQQTGGEPINLYQSGSLPQDYGIYTIFITLDSIESEYFGRCDVDIDYHTNSNANSYFVVDFGSAKPAGIVFYK